MENWTAAEVIAVFGAFGTLVTLIGKTVMDIILTARTRKAIADVKDDLATNTAISQKASDKADAAAVTAQRSATEIAYAVNGRIDDMIAAAKAQAYAEGLKAGQQQIK